MKYHEHILVHVIFYQACLDGQEFRIAHGEGHQRFAAGGLVGVDSGGNGVLVMGILGVDIHHLGPEAQDAVELPVLGDLLVQLHELLGEDVFAEGALHLEAGPVVEPLGLDEVDAGVADEVRRLQVDGIGVEAQRRIDLGDLALLEQGDLGGHGQGFHLVVGHVDDGGAGLLVEALELRPHVDAQPGVQVGQGFVQQQELGAGGDGPGDGHPLLLASGELVGIAAPVLLDPHGPEGPHDRLLDLLLLHFLDLQAEGHVFEHGHMGPEGVALEHQVQPPLAGSLVESLVRVDDHPIVDGHGAVLGLFQPGDDSKRGGFAAAGGPQQRHEVPVLDGQVHIPEDVVLSVKLIDVAQLDLAHG